ncbi:MAG: hypothetical protein EZS26_000232 [Candidatus Ordinivivax streblomastigis]|uniref:Uncharacterized protein n=1 Tax=Candidatus Ordinivivax streblomastigis TaxID=2540710 RepID=A0A5M8P5I1_9BACT|nr:MAG: hypothetical protein EZS26_000232 [Candidatus Ordinivivax streblomastigis]
MEKYKKRRIIAGIITVFFVGGVTQFIPPPPERQSQASKDRELKAAIARYREEKDRTLNYQVPSSPAQRVNTYTPPSYSDLEDENEELRTRIEELEDELENIEQ